MIKSFRELADEMNVTLDAIHKMRQRNEDIQAHCFKKGRTWHIDETGQQMIIERSNGKPKSQIADVGIYEELDKYKNRVIELQEQVIKLQALAEGVNVTKMLAENLEKEKGMLQDQNSELQDQNRELREELDSYEKSWFGLYRKVKK